jgi:hypothetical protein
MLGCNSSRISDSITSVSKLLRIAKPSPAFVACLAQRPTLRFTAEITVLQRKLVSSNNFVPTLAYPTIVPLQSRFRDLRPPCDVTLPVPIMVLIFAPQ